MSGLILDGLLLILLITLLCVPNAATDYKSEHYDECWQSLSCVINWLCSRSELLRKKESLRLGCYSVLKVLCLWWELKPKGLLDTTRILGLSVADFNVFAIEGHRASKNINARGD